jgi:hypothetical protein
MKGICGVWLTTRHNCFAECFRHSAKPRKHPAKSLPSVTLDKEVSTNCTSATTSLSSTFYRALSIEKSLSRRQVTMTETLPSVPNDTRQRGSLCRVPAGLTLGKEGSSVPPRQALCRQPRVGTRQREHQCVSLPVPLSSALGCTQQRRLLYQVPGPRHSVKKVLLIPRRAFFAKCFDHCTRQKELSTKSLTLGKE